MMNPRCSLGLAAAAIGSIAVPASANIDVLIDNTVEPIRDITILGAEAPDAIWAAQAFTTPRRATLDYAVPVIGLVVGDPLITAELRVGPDPTGPVVTTFSIDPLSVATVERTNLVPLTVATLEPGATYWVVIGSSGGGSIGWAYSEGDAYDGPGQYAGYAYSDDMGVSWGSIGIENPHQLRIEVTFLECPADLNGDGLVDFTDYLEFLDDYDSADPRVDYTADGLIDFADYLEFLNLYDGGC